MKIRFKTLGCELTRSEAIARVQEAILKDKTLYISPLNITTQEISFYLKQPFGLAFNSFLPQVYVTFSEIASGTEVQICCSLKKTTRVMLLAFMLFATALELGMVISSFIAKTSDPALLVIPGMLLFSVILTHFGLKFSSRDIRNVISSAVQ